MPEPEIHPFFSFSTYDAAPSASSSSSSPAVSCGDSSSMLTMRVRGMRHGPIAAPARGWLAFETLGASPAGD